MPPFWIRKHNIFAVPIIHYTMELAAHVKKTFNLIEPDCVAVELPEAMEHHMIAAAARLPDISVVVSAKQGSHLYYLSEPCDPCFEALRSALEIGAKGYCIDLHVEDYPLIKEYIPDPYAISRIGLKKYYEAYLVGIQNVPKHPLDEKRELHMAKRLKELSLCHEKVLFVGGFFHIQSVLKMIDNLHFPTDSPANSESHISTLTEDSCRDVMAEYGWVTVAYEQWRQAKTDLQLDRQKLIWNLYKQAASRYQDNTGNPFPGYHFRNLMKFVRNYAWIKGRLMPDLFEILSAAKGCVDHNYAYETWFLATHYPLRKNIDNLPELNLTIEEVWGSSKILKFHLKKQRRKGLEFQRRKKDRPHAQFRPPPPFSICSYPPEDSIVERFGEFLKKKGNLVLSEEGAKTIPFMNSLEDGLDMRETIRHLFEHKLYVKVKGRPPNPASSVVVVFDEDKDSDSKNNEKYPWKMTWIGEHSQESDMAFYSTPVTRNVVGPGISRCEYGGFMMTSPPRRLYDVWSDPDYEECLTKSEILLMAAIDYSVDNVIVYVAEKPPRTKIKAFANRYGKKIVYLPLGQLSPITLNKIRTFHVLDGQDKREIAGDYIF